MMNRKTKLLIWEIGCVFWVAFAGSLLHFAFELSDYWKPMAILAAVNESAWEHVKMYFWPGLFFALAQYTYTRNITNNYWLGKAMALTCTPAVIFISYFGYMEIAALSGVQPSLGTMIGIMFFGIVAGQAVSFFILSMPPLSAVTQHYATATYALLILMFSTFTYWPPKNVLFENFFCYQYTGEYGILGDYEPYRIFVRLDENGNPAAGAGVNYCQNKPVAENQPRRLAAASGSN